jgi:hypothetical protein
MAGAQAIATALTVAIQLMVAAIIITIIKTIVTQRVQNWQATLVVCAQAGAPLPLMKDGNARGSFKHNGLLLNQLPCTRLTFCGHQEKQECSSKTLLSKTWSAYVHSFHDCQLSSLADLALCETVIRAVSHKD